MHHEMKSRNFDKNPDEVRKLTNGKIELANLGDATIGRMTLGTYRIWDIRKTAR